MTLLELANQIRLLTGTGSNHLRGLPPIMIEGAPADITRAREVLGWEPRISLEVGLRKTLESLGFSPRPVPA
jgi:nucleoside-diphosphate-sugar epimerase